MFAFILSPRSLCKRRRPPTDVKKIEERFELLVKPARWWRESGYLNSTLLHFASTRTCTEKRLVLNRIFLEEILLDWNVNLNSRNNYY